MSAVFNALSYLKSISKPFILEQKISGREFTIDGWVSNKKIFIFKFFQKNTSFSSSPPLPLGYRLKKIDHQLQQKLKKLTRQAIQAFSLNHSFFSLDVISKKDGKNFIIDFGPLLDAKMDRLLYHAGIDIYNTALDLALGKTPAVSNYSLNNYTLDFAYRSTINSDLNSKILAIEANQSRLISKKLPSSVADITDWVITKTL